MEYTDTAHLTTKEYADSSKFRARTSIYQYQQPDTDFCSWALSHLPPNIERLLDVGCGPGDYLRRIDVPLAVGVGTSQGMVREALGARCAADAVALPFMDAAFDATLCMHMLYHVADIDRAIGELRRVTRPGGTVLVATNAAEHQREIRSVFDGGVAALAGRVVQPVLATDRRFRLEDAEPMLRAHFDEIERHDLPREVVLPNVEVIATYLDSIRTFHETKLPPDVSWQAAVARFVEQASEVIAREGAFRSSILAGIFLCRQ